MNPSHNSFTSWNAPVTLDTKMWSRSPLRIPLPNCLSTRKYYRQKRGVSTSTQAWWLLITLMAYRGELIVIKIVYIKKKKNLSVLSVIHACTLYSNLEGRTTAKPITTPISFQLDTFGPTFFKTLLRSIRKNTFFPNRKNNHLRLLRQQHLSKIFSLRTIFIRVWKQEKAARGQI